MALRLHCVISLITCVLSIDPLHYKSILKYNEEMCNQFGKNPYFDSEMVTGKPWRIYYSWNLNMGNRCMDMTFKNATKWTINRFYTDMSEYLEMQPAWDAATLLMTMGHANHQTLLFADQGPAGRFVGVPNIMRDSNIAVHRSGVPLLKFQMKLIRNGKYLVVMDCHIGVVSLSARLEGDPPYRAEMDSAAAEVGIGEGFPACLKDKNKNELFSE